MKREHRQHRSWKRCSALWRSERGVAAIEFGLFAPMLFFSLLTMVDLGLALQERMTLDHVLRSGAQQALADANETQVEATLRSAAAQHGWSCGASASKKFCPTAVVSCACPGGTPSTVCANIVASCPSDYRRYYTLTGSKTRDNMLLPSFQLSPSLKVQVH
jgi:pilus assembly protein CpaE